MKKLTTVALLATCSLFAYAEESMLTLQANDIAENSVFAQQQLLTNCKGKNQSPSFSWDNVPEGTKSFTLEIYDVDANWVHWSVVNIPADVTNLPANITANGSNLPEGALQTKNTYEKIGYGGACPPKGEQHDYEVTLTALDIEKLPNIKSDAPLNLIRYFARAHSLGESKITINNPVQ